MEKTKALSGVEILPARKVLKTTIKEMQKRKLTPAEKQVVSFLDASEEQSRTGTFQSFIEESVDGIIVLAYGRKELVCDSNTLISLVGKGLLQIRFGRVKLDLVVHKRSLAALRRDGYFDDTSEHFLEASDADKT